MDIVIESGPCVDSSARELADRRLRFLLRRVDWFVLSATVQLSERQREGKRCDVLLRTIPKGTITSTSTSGDWVTSVERALRQAARLLEPARTQWSPGGLAEQRRMLPERVQNVPRQLAATRARDAAVRNRRNSSPGKGSPDPAPV